MKLKEAQMLGILALVAVGIILLCMWGGEDVADPGALAQADKEVLGSPDVQPGVRDLFEELMADDEKLPAGTLAARPAEADVVIGGPAFTPPSEEAVIRDVIEGVEAKNVPFIPRRTATGTAPAPVTKAPPKAVYHVVQKGDTLSQISQARYGSMRYARLIQEANKRLIPNPDLLPVGVRLRIPPLKGEDAPRVAEATLRSPVLATRSGAKPVRTYKVKKGDNLWRIAVKCYGDGTKYKDIRDANAGVIAADDTIRDGMVLVIP